MTAELALEEGAVAEWNLMPDEMIGRVVAHVDKAVLNDLVLVDRRTRNLCNVRLRSLLAPHLHDLARRGEARIISQLFHEHNAPVLLLKHEHTILHTAIEARQLNLVQWLVQPLSSYSIYTPLSSNIIVSIGGYREAASITPRPLPEEQCKRLFDVDGPKALRAAAAKGDVELLDRLMPCAAQYPSTPVDLWPGQDIAQTPLSCGRVMRELLVELRDALMAPAATATHAIQMAEAAAEGVHEAAAEGVHEAAAEEQVATLQAALQAADLPAIAAAAPGAAREVSQRAHVLDRRLRSSDIELHFSAVYGAEQLQGLKAREESALAEGRPLFNWRWGDAVYTPHEALGLSSALECAVASDRIDLCDWLFDSWHAGFVSLHKNADRLTELTLAEDKTRIGCLLEPVVAQTEINYQKGKRGARLGEELQQVYVDNVVSSWHSPHDETRYTCDVSGAHITGARYRWVPPRDGGENPAYDLCEDEHRKLSPEAQARYVRFPPPPPKDCAMLARSIRKSLSDHLDQLAQGGHGYRGASQGVDDALKALLKRVEPTTDGHGAMLDYLIGRGFEPPRLSVVVCAGATWALEWLLARGLVALDEPVYPRKGYGSRTQGCSRTAHGFSRELRRLAPWLASAVSQHARAGNPLSLGSVLAALAVSRGALALVELLVARGVDSMPRLRLAGDRTLLHVVARNAPVYAVVWLVENGHRASLVHRSADGTSPLHEAILAGHVPIVCHLLEQGGAAADDPHDPKCIAWDELGVRSKHEAIRKIADGHRAERACTTLLPNILRAQEGSDADMLARLDALLAQHASAIRERIGSWRGSQREYTRLIRAALDGGRAPVFFHWLYAMSGLFKRWEPGIGARVLNLDDWRDNSCVTHLALCRALADEHGGSAGAAPEVTAALDELAAAAARAEEIRTQLHSLDERLIHLWQVGGAVAEIESLAGQIHALLAEDPRSDEDSCRAFVYGMSMSLTGRMRGKLLFRVNQVACQDAGGATIGNGNGNLYEHALGHFELLTSCALNGHLHLVDYLLAKEAAAGGGETPNSRVSAALVTTLEWNGPLAAVQALCAYLTRRGVDLSAIQRLHDADEESSSDNLRESAVGVLENALQGILSEWYLITTHASQCGTSSAPLSSIGRARMDSAFATVAWLVSSDARCQEAKLRPGAFAELLGHHILANNGGMGRPNYARSPRSDETAEKRQRERDVAESQALVLRLTRLCVEQLGALWSDKGPGRRRERGDASCNALQLLTNAGWMEAVGWLARERGAPLQGLVEGEMWVYSSGRQSLMETLRQMQEEQARSWERAEGAL